MMDKIKHTILYLAWVPLVAGVIGYCCMGGMDVGDGLYATIALYFVNPVSEMNNICIYIAKYTAVLVTATLVWEFIRILIVNINRLYAYVPWIKDSTVIYTDEDNTAAKQFSENLKHEFLVYNPDVPIKGAKRHVIMFADDLKNLDFYFSHESELAGKKVYMIAENLDFSLLKTFGTKSNVELHYINRYDLMARSYWMNHQIEVEKEEPQIFKIGIIGCYKAGRAIFRYGYINNVFSKSLKIEYHIWGCKEGDKGFLGSLNTMNQDTITVHEDLPLRELDVLLNMDRIIIADSEDKLDLLQELLYKDSSLSIHFYSETPLDLNRILAGNSLTVFGDIKQLLTEENVMNEKLYYMGKLFNYDYHLLGEKVESFDEDKMEEVWQNTDGYGKESSVARADRYLMHHKYGDSISEEDIDELEHIGWCRFMYSIHYRYDTVKNKETRKHPDLVDFGDMEHHEQEKDSIHDEQIKKRLEEAVRSEKD